MSKIDPYDPIDEWADVATWHVCRFNVAYRAWLNGLVQDVSWPGLWGGTEAQQEEMRQKMLVLAQQIDMVYEPPVVESMNNVVQVSYILPAGTQQGAVMSFNQWNQLKFNTLVGDTTGEATLTSPGSVLLPTGDWLLDLRYNLYSSSGGHAPVKIDHGGSDIILSDVYVLNSVPVNCQHAVASDGENAITVWLNPGSAWFYFGYSVVYNIARTVGTLTFIELPA
jgi:hypothetical protein